MKQTNIELLRERIEQNYEDFKAEMLEHDPETIFHMARTIAAVEDVKFYMDTYEWTDEEETAYLLDFTEPLKMLADAWEEFLDDQGPDFRMVLETVLDNEGNEENYITLALERELREKYGEDCSTKEALISEIIEYGGKYLEYLKLYDGQEDDDWFNEE